MLTFLLLLKNFKSPYSTNKTNMRLRNRGPSDQQIARKLIRNALVNLNGDNLLLTAGAVSQMTNMGTGGAAYDADVVLGTAANGKPHPAGTCVFFAASGTYLSTPDAAANSITGSFVLIAYVTPDDWTPGGDKTLVSKWTGTGNQKSYRLDIDTTGVLNLLTSADGSVAVTSASTAGPGFTNGTGHWVMAIFNDTADTSNFFTSNDSPLTPVSSISWSQLGTADVAHVSAGIKDSTAIVEVGTFSVGTGGTFAGNISRVVIISGTDETAAAVVDMDPRNQTDPANGDTATFSSGGVTWTQHGNTFIQNTGHTTVHSIGSFGLETTAGQTIASPGTVFLVGRMSNTPSANARFFDSRSNGAANWIIQSVDASTDRFAFFQGTSNVLLTEAFDNDPHVYTAQFNGDATSKLTASDIGNRTGDGGSDDWDYCTLFASTAAGSTMQGYIASLIVFDYQLSETQVAILNTHLASQYRI